MLPARTAAWRLLLASRVNVLSMHRQPGQAERRLHAAVVAAAPTPKPGGRPSKTAAKHEGE